MNSMARRTVVVELDSDTAPFDVSVVTFDNTAIAGQDYSAANATLSFTGLAGETQSFQIPIVDDPIVEEQESFFVGLALPTLDPIDISDVAEITISSDDQAQLTVADVTLDEASGSATVTVTLDAATAVGFTVPVSTFDDTAVAGQDYAATATTLSFSGLANEMQTFEIAIIDDTDVEQLEQFTVNLGSPTFPLVDSTDTGQVTIVNNDTAELLIDDVSVLESDGVASVTVRLDQAIAFDYQFSLTTTAIAPASAPEDFIQTDVMLDVLGRRRSRTDFRCDAR